MLRIPEGTCSGASNPASVATIRNGVSISRTRLSQPALMKNKIARIDHGRTLIFIAILLTAQRCDQTIDAALHFLDDQFLRRRLVSFKNFEIIPALTQTVLSSIADARSSKDAETFL